MLNINKFNHIKSLRKHYKILVMWTIFEIGVQIPKQSAVKGKCGVGMGSHLLLIFYCFCKCLHYSYINLWCFDVICIMQPFILMTTKK